MFPRSGRCEQGSHSHPVQLADVRSEASLSADAEAEMGRRGDLHVLDPEDENGGHQTDTDQ